MRPSSTCKIWAALVAGAVVFGMAAGCRKAPAELAPEVASSDEALFKLGEEAMKKKDEERGLLYLRQVIDSFPRSFYAQRAKLLIADAYFRKGDEGNMILAAAEYREFINLYPYSPSAAYCQYRIAMTFFTKALKPGRDQTKTAQALAEFKQVITRFPESEQAKDAQEKIRECEERLAAHSFLIAQQYHRERAYKAATSRLTELLTSYPNYTQMDGVYFYLGDAYFQWSKAIAAAKVPLPAKADAPSAEQAVPYFTKLLTDYPNSEYAGKAQDRLKEIETLLPKKT